MKAVRREFGGGAWTAIRVVEERHIYEVCRRSRAPSESRCDRISTDACGLYAQRGNAGNQISGVILCE